jgi:hypothetical protein
MSDVKVTNGNFRGHQPLRAREKNCSRVEITQTDTGNFAWQASMERMVQREMCCMLSSKMR